MNLPQRPLPLEVGSLQKGVWRWNADSLPTPPPLSSALRLGWAAEEAPGSRAATHCSFYLEVVGSMAAFQLPHDEPHWADPHR